MLGAVLVVPSLAASCSNGQPVGDEPVTLRVGVLPDRAETSLRAQYAPLMHHLETTADVRTELVIPADYGDLVTRFRSGELDLAWFGGLTFLQSGADPLAMRDVDLEFTSDYLVAADAPGGRIEDFAGSRFSFGPEQSTSGHLMPRYFLDRAGIQAEQLFGSVSHSHAHDETAAWVRDGVVDIGVVNSVVVESMFMSGELSPDEVRVLVRTDPYRDYTWATRPDLDGAVRIRLLDALLALSPADDDDRKILSLLGAGGFVPAERDDFADLSVAAAELGLLDPDGAG